MEKRTSMPRLLTIEKKPDGALALGGRFDASQVDTAAEAFRDLSESTTLDFTNLNYISSAGLGTLVALRQRLAEAGGTLTLTNMNAHVREVFKISALDRIFIIT